MGRGEHSHSKREENSKKELDQSKTKTQCGIEFCSCMPAFWVTWGGVSSAGHGQLSPCGLTAIAHMGSLSWAGSADCLHFPLAGVTGISIVLWFPLQLCLYSQSFRHWPVGDCLQGFQSCHTFPGLSGFPLKFQQKPLEPPNFCPYNLCIPVRLSRKHHRYQFLWIFS